jgi:metal-sulfur cluster biosynthetic enzyme
MVTKEEVLEALKRVIDPEIGMNIVDMNLIRDIQIEEDKVKVKMTLTIPGCPLAGVIISQAKRQLESLEGVSQADMELVWD